MLGSASAFCWPSVRPRATSPCPPHAVLHNVAWYEYTFGVVTTRSRVLKASSSYFSPSRKGVPLASQGAADWVRPGPQARAGIGQALVGRRSGHEDGYYRVCRSPRRRGSTLPSRGVPRSTWRHGVSFQHDNYGDAAPDVDTEHTTRRGGPGGQLSAVV